MPLRKTAARLRSCIPAVLVLFLGACGDDDGSTGSSAAQGERVSRPFEYSGYSSPEYSSYVKSSQYVIVSDGIELAVDVFLPSDGAARSSFPVVFTYTPYNRGMMDPATGTVAYDFALTSLGELLLSHGYALVAADMRGTGASTGRQCPFSPELGRDGKELVDWMAAQSWCDGNVGMIGGSYVGWSQFATARNRPEALKCITPEVILSEGYTEGFRPGGIAAIRWISSYTALLQAFNLNMQYADYGLLPATPAYDEDADGDLADEIPLMDEGDPSTFLDDIFIPPLGPSYPDGGRRYQHKYFKATLDHLFNPTFQSLGDEMPYFDSHYVPPWGDLTYVDGSPGYMLNEMRGSGIAIYNIGRWFDAFCRGAPMNYATIRTELSSKLIVGPGFHQGLPDAYIDYFSYSGDIEQQSDIERLRFFDRYLKGIENGIDTEPPVYLYVMNDGWRAEDEWPIARQMTTPLYLDQGNWLAPAATAEGADNHDVDFTHRSSYGSTLSDRWIMIGYPDAVMTRTDKDAQCLVYETEPLGEDTEVTGYAIADLWVTSNQRYGDFFVYLCDVDPSGESVYVTEGELREGWHRLQPDDDRVNGVLDIRPDLPWHGYKEAQWVEGALDATTPLNLRFDLVPVSWLFKEGHRIRIAIAGSDYPNFELNPGLAPNGDPAELPETTITVHRTAAYPSRIELPVIPR
ncbi:MAG: CocE/NonD family hydrolase [bacterium]